MKHPVRKALALGLAMSMLSAGPALAQEDDNSADDIELAQAQAVFADMSGDRIVVNTFADSTDADAHDDVCADESGHCSLRAAVQTANAGTGKQVIALETGTYALTIAGDGGAEAGDLDVASNIVLNGNGATIDLSELGDRAFDVAEGAELSARNLSVTAGSPADGESGGAFSNAGTLVLIKVTAAGNDVVGAGASGGAIFNTGTAKVFNSSLTGNSAARAGGAIEANAGRTIVFQSSMTFNTTGAMPGNGGALHLTGEGYVRVARTDVADNTAASEGGGLWNSSTGTMVVRKSTFNNNVANGIAADNGGGGLFNDGGTMTVWDSSVDGNSAPMGSGSGGGILNNGGSLKVTRTTVNGNDAARAGGGIEVVNGTTDVINSMLSDNVTGAAPGNGGGLHASGAAAVVTIERSDVTGNVAASEGGGLWAGGGESVMTVISTDVSGNAANGIAADNGGGGLFNNGGQLTIKRSTINNNTATMGSGSGGGILNLGTLDVKNTDITYNSAARAGGGIESNAVAGAGDATLVRVNLMHNTTGAAPGNGGGMHVTGSTITTVIISSVVKGNDAANEGGGLWNFAGATMTVTRTVVDQNTSPIGPNVFQNGDGGNFTVNGDLIPAGDNNLAFP